MRPLRWVSCFDFVGVETLGSVCVDHFGGFQLKRNAEETEGKRRNRGKQNRKISVFVNGF